MRGTLYIIFCATHFEPTEGYFVLDLKIVLAFISSSIEHSGNLAELLVFELALARAVRLKMLSREDRLSRLAKRVRGVWLVDSLGDPRRCTPIFRGI